MWRKTLVSMFMVLFSMYSCLYAEVIPGRWEKVEALKQGSTIVVTLETGDILQGEFTALEEESIRMIMYAREREYPKSAVSKISRIEMGRSKAAKTGIYSAIGFAIGFGLGAAIGSGYKHLENSEIAGGMTLGIIAGGIGTAAGLVSKQTSKKIVIYKAVSAPAKNRMNQ